MSANTITAATAGRPSHIVLFKSSSEQNEGVLVQAFGLKKSRAKTSASGVKLLSARRAQGPQTKLFSRIAAAAVDLDDADIEKLQAEKSVVAVFPNELRTIPKPISTPSVAQEAAEDDPMTAYLRGMRDAADLALRYAGAAGYEAERPAEQDEAVTAGGYLRSRRRRRPTMTWALEAIGMQAGGSPFTGRGVKLAVLDTGIDLDHPDLRGRVVEGISARSFIDNESVQDGNGHGTHCAGLAAGPARPVRGARYGVGPGIELLVGKVLSNAGSGFDDGILEGMEWAVDQGANILSMSLGSARQVGDSFNAAYENIAKVLIDDSAGTLIIAAAGNESNRTAFLKPVGNPAAAPSIMGVAAIDEQRNVAWFSCAQLDEVGTLDISAPGVDIHSSWTGGGYNSISGTSMATPIVAGAAALWREAEPDLTPRKLWERLVSTAVPLGANRDFGNGLVQIPLA